MVRTLKVHLGQDWKSKLFRENIWTIENFEIIFSNLKVISLVLRSLLRPACTQQVYTNSKLLKFRKKSIRNQEPSRLNRVGSICGVSRGTF